MTTRTGLRPRKLSALLALTAITALATTVALGAGLLLAAPANAGTYTVSGTCGLWSPYNADPSHLATYQSCPSLIARMAWGPFSTTSAAPAGWRFDAPAGTAIASASLSGLAFGLNGWQAAVYAEGGNGLTIVGCPGPSCPGGGTSIGGSYALSNANAIVTRVRCGASSCSNNGDYNIINISGASITLVDPSAPGAALTGGSLLSGGWKSGTQTLVIDGNDNSGVSETRALLDGSRVRAVSRGCDFSQKVPCPNGGSLLDIPLAGITDGPHTVSAQSVDAAGNVGGSAGATIYVDQTPPSQPTAISVANGPGFRSANAFDVSWKNPPQNLAPIAGAVFRLCPTVAANADSQSTAKAQAACVQGSRAGTNLSEIKDLKLPGPGSFDLKLWLLDSAGNQQPASAAEIDGLGYDDTPPADLAFMTPDPQDPTRVTVRADDGVSGLASGSIEVRKDGQDAWQPLQSQLTAAGVTAVLDDETLPKGAYWMRATVTNAAGLQASTDRTADGNPATVKLPIRLASHLAAGRRGRRHCRGHGAHRHCHRRLAPKPIVHIGRTTRLYGRLRVAGKAMPGAQLEVWRRLDLDGAGWGRIGTVTTSKTGWFSYRARRGPARVIRFRYSGTGTIRGRNADVGLRVRAMTTFRPSRRHAINGEPVTFRGHVMGGWIPSTGVLVELQVRTGGKWRTFAQPRADAAGRWSYEYRFTTVRGRASYVMRARVRRQPGLPFTTGTSRRVRVRVRGL
jgi:hypothetical protein